MFYSLRSETTNSSGECLQKSATRKIRVWLTFQWIKNIHLLYVFYVFLKPDVVIAGTTVVQKDEETRCAMTNALTQNIYISTIQHLNSLD